MFRDGEIPPWPWLRKCVGEENKTWKLLCSALLCSAVLLVQLDLPIKLSSHFSLSLSLFFLFIIFFNSIYFIYLYINARRRRAEHDFKSWFNTVWLFKPMVTLTFKLITVEMKYEAVDGWICPTVQFGSYNFALVLPLTINSWVIQSEFSEFI